MSDQDKGSKADIIYTKVDEAPELASGSFLPIIRKFAAAAGVSIGTMDISLAGRIIANFPENLTVEQRQPDHLAELGVMVNEPGTNVIKLPNISASVPQLNAAIKELQEGGYDIPSYPDNPQNEEEKRIKATFGTVLGSAVNPVLRQGNSDRRAPNAVKEYAKANPHRMGAWAKESKTHVATMDAGDFRSNEKSTTVSSGDVGPARIEYVNSSGAVTALKNDLSLTDGEVIDATKMSVTELRSFLEGQITEAKDQGILFSLHLKATMMKVADPIIFGHTVS
ncbi:MAG: NADP-dependent isocitrate dehydrogenase, partial [Rhodospirillales bacterium]|nr:NADP-dependent isocitrate dehydrogenase [Rhodospirillales bacterium]